MHILVTADTVGGVWTYTRELVTGLSRRGIRVTLVSFGGVPERSQRAWLGGLAGVTYLPTAFALEWMQEQNVREDLADSAKYLLSIVRERKPDLLHLSQYCYGSLAVAMPKVVVAHSDVMSWHETVRGSQPRDEWTDWYRETVKQGLAGATAVVAPSRWMLSCIEKCYGAPQKSRVIYNGRTPALFDPFARKQAYAASVGRFWDEGKQSHLLSELTDAPLPILLAGVTTLGGQGEGNSGPGKSGSGVKFKGRFSEEEMSELLSQAGIYIATSKYEPFGLAPLEAAFSRCAILANDIPSFREIWGDAALYFSTNDAESLSEKLARLHGDRELRLAYANRAYDRACRQYTADRMVEEYVELYSSQLERGVSAA
jgi:glycosyltransferase involved in cell wall biosynthesis